MYYLNQYKIHSHKTLSNAYITFTEQSTPDSSCLCWFVTIHLFFPCASHCYLIVMLYWESNIKVIFHNISYNFLLIFQVKKSHPVGFCEHINLDYIYLLETNAYQVHVPRIEGVGPFLLIDKHAACVVLFI